MFILPRRCWLFLLFLGISFSTYAQPAPPKTPLPNNTLIQAAGSSEIYLLLDGRKHYIQSLDWIAKHGYKSPVHILKPAELAAIPTGDVAVDKLLIPIPASAFSGPGVLLAGPDSRIYLAKNGERHWILDPRWIEESAFSRQEAIAATPPQLDSLRLGSDIAYITTSRKIVIALLTAVLAMLLFLGLGERGRNLVSEKQARFVRPVVAAIFAFLIAIREPYLLVHPRFWAEEGLFWFQYASRHSIIDSLLYVFPPSSYFNFVANIGAVLSSRTAHYFGLLYAPDSTTLLAFLIQITAICLILFPKSRLFDTLTKAIAGCMIVLFASTTPDEIWLNSINSMGFLGFMTLALLFGESQDWPSWLKWFTRVVLLLAGLSSPYAIALTPLFLISAWHNKGRERKVQCAILVACLLVQGSVVIKTRRNMITSGLPTYRGENFRLDAAAINMFCEHMAHPALGKAGRETFFELTGLKEASTSASSVPPRPFTRTLRRRRCPLCDFRGRYPVG